MPRVSFHYSNGPVAFKGRTQVKAMVENIFRSEKLRLDSLSYVFCSDKQVLEMNKQWLGHDTYTDIISFDLSEKGQGITGEVYISTDRVKENARRFETTFQDELCRVIFHGALHLCGYKDKTEAQQREMRKQETKWLSRIGRST